ncbi:HNH endonuclease [Cytobacillus sp. Bac17]|uniref:HNH endonuclease n=1 Tax=Cytobacillus sp. Bac17 TaxID=2926008 RepID=UPI002118D90B|nr:HNH endonuclease [Cytobacillus sp. Bac17]
MDRASILSRVCESIDSGDKSAGAEIINYHYPFEKIEYVKRTYTKADMLTIFLRDHFIDRYSGERMIFPPVLRLLSEIYPSEFPFHPNWRFSECHPAYWDLFPTIDHIVPVTRGGTNNIENLVTTSMKRNSAKSNFTLEELDWKLYTPSINENWDGKLSWFIKMIAEHPAFLNNRNLKEWFVATRNVLSIRH